MAKDHKKVVDEIRKYSEDKKVGIAEAAKALGYKDWEWSYSNKMLNKGTKAVQAKTGEKKDKVKYKKRKAAAVQHTRVEIPNDIPVNDRVIVIVANSRSLSGLVGNLLNG